jgi:hypothetical protein
MTAPALTPRDQGTRPSVYVHIGEAKTGTTHLQNLLYDNREALRADGLLYSAAGGSGHVLETLDLRGITFKNTPDPEIAGTWRRLVRQIREWGGPALISSELLAPAARQHINRLQSSLDFADVHIVFTVRDMARQLPAAWQERIKNRGQETFAEWLRCIHDPDPQPNTAGKHFRNLHDVTGILARWSEDLPPNRVHVVTVPPSGGDPRLLWTRFAEVIGVDPKRYEEPDRGVNRSLGAAEVSVVRQVNVALGGDEFPWPPYDRFMKWYLSPKLAERQGLPIELPESEFEWAVATSQRIAKDIAEAGYDVVGDLGELIPAGRPSGMDPDQVPAELLADAGVAGTAALVQRLADGESELLDVRRQVEAAESELLALRSRVELAERTVQDHADLPPGERIKRCVVELSGQVRWLGAALRWYRRIRRRPMLAA